MMRIKTSFQLEYKIDWNIAAIKSNYRHFGVGWFTATPLATDVSIKNIQIEEFDWFTSQ